MTNNKPKNIKEITKMIRLYKITKDGLKFVDYGVNSQADNYSKQGYIVIYK